MPNCPKCGKEGNVEDFCNDNGTLLWGNCSKCGAAVNSTQKFCGNCGTRNELA